MRQGAPQQATQTAAGKTQPYAVVFHEKEDRRHAHVVWSRIDVDQMKAIPMSHFKMKLQDVSRDLFIQHGWDMTKGLEDGNNRDPLLKTWWSYFINKYVRSGLFQHPVSFSF